VVIAVLAVIWVVCLTPMMLRKLAERRFSTSVDSFHRQLRGLRRAYPRLAASAADPEALLYSDEIAYYEPRRTPRAPAHVPRPASRPRPSRHTSSAARRRQVLAVLTAAAVGFLALGMVPVLRVLWGLSLLAFAAAAGYLALLIYIHRRAVERQMKVVDIAELRNTDLRPTAPVVHRRSVSEEMDDEYLDAAFEYSYDEILVGGR